MAWHGNDFSPEHLAQATTLGNASGARLHLTGDSFAQFADRADLPDFDFIGLHGVWSWVSAENRRTITGFIARRLKPGGVVYASYNMLPGWGPFLSLREVMLSHSEQTGSGQRINRRIEAARAFAQALQAVAPGFAAVPGQDGGALAQLAGQDPRYLAHEYLNRDWHPMHFDALHTELTTAGLEFACSATAVDHVPALDLSAAQQAFLAGCPTPVLRELTRDIMLDRKFRRDYWVKGLRRLEPTERRERLRDLRFVTLAAPGSEKTRLPLARGELTLKPETTATLMGALRAHRTPLTLAEIERSGAAGALPFDQQVQALMLQVQAGNIAVAQDEAVIDRARPTSVALNAAIMAGATTGGPIRYLASPVTGGGVPVDRLVCLLLSGCIAGAASPESLAERIWAQLRASGAGVAHAGRTIQGAEQSIAHLRGIAAGFLERGLPTFRALGVL